ncbi:glycosyltransferase family protein [Marinirhabdus gelatinilytica]|uniref:Glycosyltransferase involved in cell wall biosynthesis n=1 Tax=Marinirhabdus gelatinilytica TaxID=1703343 RepID=A0A370Q911_9FLAO|nr:glycosyltransferase [Marinirhabdus gelatinilytica]RDK84809.1 glycosyltransferase involved in cell wall biosynthesis [Marinirhabdus gelatinilytica]
MSKNIYYINRYNLQKRKEIRENTGYEQIVKYSSLFKPITGNELLAKIVLKVLKLKLPKNYLKITISEEIKALFIALLTGAPIFYLYADKDAFLLPLLKRKFGLKQVKLFGTLHWPIETSQKFSFYEKNLIFQFDGIITLSSSLTLLNHPNQITIPHGININYWQENDTLKFKNFYLIIGVSNRDHEKQIQLIKQIKYLDNTARFVVLIDNKVIYNLYEGLLDLEVIKTRISDAKLKELYVRCKAVILIQKYCLASNLVLECIATTTPIIANNVGDIAEYLGKRYPLFLSQDNQPNNLEKFIFDNENYRRKILEYLSGLRDTFNWPSIVNNTVKFINNS